MSQTARQSLIERIAPPLGVILILCNLAAFGQQQASFFELATHFRVQYVLVAGVLTLFFISFSAWRWVGLMMLIIGLNGWYIAQAHIAAEPPRVQVTQETDLVILHNIHVERDDFNSLARTLNNSDAALIILQEYTRAAEQALVPALSGTYPFQLRQPADNPYGIAAFSRMPLTTLATEPLVDPRVNSLRFMANLPHAGMVNFTAVHPPSPMSAGNAIMRDNELRTAADWVGRQDSPRVLLGDFNTTAYSAIFDYVVRESGLTPVQPIDPLAAASWPEFMMVDFLRLAIDHVLISSDLAFRTVETEFGHGSDHAMVRISLRKR